MKDRQSRSVWRNAALVAILILLCAVGSVAAIQFVGMPFLQAGAQKASISTAQQVAEATATYGPDQDPPPHPVSTGTIIWSLPTPDYSLDERAPTAVFDPTLPTLEPTVEVDSVAPTLPPLNIVTPASETRTYTDPVLGFSVEYPSNFSVEEPILPESRGTGASHVTFRNFDNVIQKGLISPDQLRIDISITTLDRFSNLEEWTAVNRDTSTDPPDSGISQTPIEYLKVAGVPAVRWTTTAPTIPEGSTVVGLMKDGRIIMINGFPATSKYLDVFEQFVASFKFS